MHFSYISLFLNRLASSFIFLTNNEVKLKAVDKSDFVDFRFDMDFSHSGSSHDFT